MTNNMDQHTPKLMLKLLMLLAAILPALLTSCGSGHKKSSDQNHAPVGPISHDNFIAQFPNKATNTCPVPSNGNTTLKYLNKPRQSNLTDSSCGSILYNSGAHLEFIYYSKYVAVYL